MILKSVQIQKFKSANNTGEFEVQPDATALVGKNESGKTAVLEAVYRANPAASGGHATEFDELRDYPRRRRNADRERIPDTEPVALHFELDDADVSAVEKQLGKGALESRTIVVSKNYRNKRLWNIRIDEAKVVKKLLADHSVDRKFAAGCSTVRGLREKLEALEEPGDAVVNLIETVAELDPQATARTVLVPRLPKFLYFDEYSTLPGRFSIPYLQGTDEGALDPGERTALALLRLAGVDSEEFTEKEYEARKAALEAAANQITDEVFSYWSQNADLAVEFDLDFKAPSEGEGQDPPFLHVRIRNPRHRVTLEFDNRSRGFVWFFSFVAAFSEYRHKDRLIILLDEPGLSLHAAAQDDLLRYIDEQLAPQHQVIYTTHSPFMIQPGKFERVRAVEDKDEVGTIVGTDFLNTSRETLFPLQAALGVEVGQTLAGAPDNLVVEGPADVLYLDVMSAHLKCLGRTGLDPRWRLVPAGGLDKIPAFISLFGADLNVATVFDVGIGGQQRITQMAERGIVPSDKLIPITAITGTKQGDTEDLFAPEFYLNLARGAGLLSATLADLPGGSRIVKRIEEYLGEEFSHYEPAFHLLRNQVELLEKIDGESLNRFEALFVRINNTLS